MATAWPGGAPAAVTLGWDDGTAADRRLVERLHQFGVRATFFLNSGKLGMSAAQSGWKDYVSRAEVADLYAGLEVGSHTIDHPDLTALTDEAIARQVAGDRAALEDLVGYPVTGFASPFRAQDARVEAVLAEVGIRYSRGPGRDRLGTPPSDPLRWTPAAHCFDDVAAMLRRPRAGAAYCVWGHSYEYDERNAWNQLDDLLRTVRDSGCWVATHGEVIDWLTR